MTAPRPRAEPREGVSWVRVGPRIEAPVLLGSLPPEVPFGFVGRVAPTSADLRLDLELHRIPPREALAALQSTGAVAKAELARGEFGEDGRPSQLELEAESAEELGRAVAGRRQELFRVGILVRARSGSRSRAEHLRLGLLRRLQALGFRTRLPIYEAGDAVAASTLVPERAMPAGFWHTLSTDGAAAFFPFVDGAIIEPGGVLVGLLLEDASPVVLDRFAHSSYSWGLFGATGSGKSFAAALWALRTRWKVPGLELYVVDPLGEFAGLARALGGQVVAFGPDAPTRWHPLDPSSTGGDRVEKAARVGTLLRGLFPTLRDEEAAQLDRALSRLFVSGDASPTFAALQEELLRERSEAGRLPDLLEVFRSGSLRHLDAPSIPPPLEDPTVFDLHTVPEPQLAFHLAYVLDAIYHRLRRNDRPKLVLVDEAHLLARVPGTAEFLDRLTRHVRHYRTGLLLLSQNPDDFLAHDAGRSLLRNLRATVLLRLPEVSPKVREFFDLTEAEAEWLPRARLPKEAGYSEALLRLGPSHLPLAVAASTPEYEFLREALGGATRTP
jgi:hypothetical protein